ncbi:MAG: MBL fold metallo-hydrolase [Victivallales bacterium]|jgi:phosphoribosyl 1,2-cyclic phosphodiesterase|nr:MBL fold metallo-hydrolase [Victivallales bacterium]MBT7163414.1 MBL fold metallo-hydrolase [Victivallales bacterium]
MAVNVERVGITVLGSGSRGNAVVIHTESEAILVDAGFSARELRKRMARFEIDETKVRAILVSHEHSDHVCGMRVCAKQLGIPIYANRGTAEVLRSRDDKLGNLTIFAPGSPFGVGGFTVEPFTIPHDAYDPVAFVVKMGTVKLGIATDLGHVNSLVSHQLRACDALVVESNHDIGMLRNSDRKWSLKQRIIGRHGHLSNEDGLELLRKVLHGRTQAVIMAHASGECNEYSLVERGVKQCLAELEREDIVMHVATQDDGAPTVWVSHAV